MKKVILTCGIFPPEIGGPATYISRFAKYLSEEGLEVEVITLTDFESSIGDIDGYKITKISRKNPRFVRRLQCISAIRKAISSADYILSNGLYTESAIALAINGKRPRSVAKVVGDPVWERSKNRGLTKTNTIEDFHSSKLSLREKLQTLIHVLSLRVFDSVSVPGRGLVGVLTNLSKRIRPVLIENGVPEIQCHQSKKTIDIIVVSRLVPWKNVDVLIQIAVKNNLKMIVVGEGPERSKLEAIAQENSCVKFVGGLSQEDVNKLLCNSRIFCQMSDYEGMSFSLLQAMSVGLPCLLSDIEGNRQIFEQDQGACSLVNHKQISQIESSLLHLLDSSELQAQMGIRAKMLIAKNYSENVQFAKMKKLLEIS